jgi:hypothetical protein
VPDPEVTSTTTHSVHDKQSIYSLCYMYTGTTLHILQSGESSEQEKLLEERGNGYSDTSDSGSLRPDTPLLVPVTIALDDIVSGRLWQSLDTHHGILMWYQTRFRLFIPSQ